MQKGGWNIHVQVASKSWESQARTCQNPKLHKTIGEAEQRELALERIQGGRALLARRRVDKDPHAHELRLPLRMFKMTVAAGDSGNVASESESDGRRRQLGVFVSVLPERAELAPGPSAPRRPEPPLNF